MILYNIFAHLSSVSTKRVVFLWLSGLLAMISASPARYFVKLDLVPNTCTRTIRFWSWSQCRRKQTWDKRLQFPSAWNAAQLLGSVTLQDFGTLQLVCFFPYLSNKSRPKFKLGERFLVLGIKGFYLAFFERHINSRSLLTALPENLMLAKVKTPHMENAAKMFILAATFPRR